MNWHAGRVRVQTELISAETRQATSGTGLSVRTYLKCLLPAPH